MSEPNDDVRKALNELANELARAMEQGGRIVREAVKDVRGWAGAAAVPPPGPGPSPVEAIRQLAELRDAGLLSEEEFQAKKTELLGRI